MIRNIRQRELMMHALGNPKSGQLPYRNYFCAAPNGDDDKELAILVDDGMVQKTSSPTEIYPYNCYSVTEKGRQFLGVLEPIR